MNCLAVRDRLPEHALSSLSARDRSSVERHLGTCAACRKEAEMLEDAGAIFAFSAPPVDPPDDLGERIATSVRRKAVKESTIRRRMRITAVAAFVAAAVAVTGFGWGAVMADRAGDAELRAQRADRARETAAAAAALFDDEFVSGPRASVRSGQLTAPDGGQGDGWGFAASRPGQSDVAYVRVLGLPPTTATPLRVWLTDGAELRLLVARVGSLDPNGGFEHGELTRLDLSSAAILVVKDVDGDSVLSGEVVPTEG
ncbi:MAG: anti-sigma factor [Actinomycetota bacterium]